jgi:uncharacterized membrane protein
LISSGLIGSDIHSEYYFYYKALGGWNYADPHPYNSSIGSTLIAPFLTNVFGIPGYWIFKLVFPLLFSFVPVLLYFVFKKEFGAKTAFLASIFFVIVPTWSMEMIGIPRQMLGEIMLALVLFVVIVKKWRLRIKIPILIVIGILGITLHYIIGPLIILYLGLGGIFLLFFKRRVLPIKWLSLIVIVLVACSGLYYGAVGRGMTLKCLTTGVDVVVSFVVDVLPDSFSFLRPEVDLPNLSGKDRPDWADPNLVTKKKPVVVENPPVTTTNPTATVPETSIIPTTPMIPATPEVIEKLPIVAISVVEDDPRYIPGLIANPDPVIRAAWGGDFTNVDIWGKIFRIFQYATQLCVIVGCIILFKDRKKYSAEYLSFCWVSVLILSACMFIPHFAGLVNATRFYHLALFLLAPVFVLGGRFIFRNFKILTVSLIIPYFIFTSGVVFELTRQTDIDQINIPYSISLSNHRVDMVGVFTSNDTDVRDWAVANDIVENTYADTHSQLLLWETAYTYWKDLRSDLLSDNLGVGRYIFLSERNNQSQTVILRPITGGSTSGRRVSCSYSELGLDKVISEGKIVYQQGDALILKIKDD